MKSFLLNAHTHVWVCVLLFLIAALSSCDDPETQTATIAKARYTFQFHQVVVTPSTQNNFYVTDMHDNDTGTDYIIIQDVHGSISVTPIPQKKAEKPQ